jgi:hypothetical protein
VRRDTAPWASSVANSESIPSKKTFTYPTLIASLQKTHTNKNPYSEF